MYFIDIYRKRDKAETYIADMIINLRYYYDNWPRAKIFATNLEFVFFPMKVVETVFDKKAINEESSDEDEYGDIKHKKFTQPHSYLKDTENSDNDIYCQEFFLHAYSLLAMDRK
jgi:hypothetical protein